MLRRSRRHALLELATLQDPSGNPALGQGAGQDQQSQQKWLGWAVAEKRSDRCIGMVNFHHREQRNRRLEIGYILSPAQQGKGLMTEVLQTWLDYSLEDLGVHRIEAIIHPGNTASIRLVKRLGFRLEGGPLRDYWRNGDTFMDTMMYSLIAGEEAWKRGARSARASKPKPKSP